MTATLVYLSDGWLDAADRALAELAPLDGDGLRVGYRIGGGPEGERTHTLVLGPDRVGIERGLVDVEVTLAMDWDLAVEIASGRTSAQRAFLDGRIRLGGDPGRLLGRQEALAAIDDRLADLRAITAYQA